MDNPFNSTKFIICFNSSNLEPISLPFPDIVSSSTVVVCSFFNTSFNVSAIIFIPASIPCPTWLPG